MVEVEVGQKAGEAAKIEIKEEAKKVATGLAKAKGVALAVKAST